MVEQWHMYALTYRPNMGFPWITPPPPKKNTVWKNSCTLYYSLYLSSYQQGIQPWYVLSEKVPSPYACAWRVTIEHDRDQNETLSWLTTYPSKKEFLCTTLYEIWQKTLYMTFLTRKNKTELNTCTLRITTWSTDVLIRKACGFLPTIMLAVVV